MFSGGSGDGRGNTWPSRSDRREPQCDTRPQGRNQNAALGNSRNHSSNSHSRFNDNQRNQSHNNDSDRGPTRYSGSQERYQEQNQVQRGSKSNHRFESHNTDSDRGPTRYSGAQERYQEQNQVQRGSKSNQRFEEHQTKERNQISHQRYNGRHADHRNEKAPMPPQSSRNHAGRSQRNESDQKKFCQYYLNGRCRLGTKCNYIHGLSLVGSATEHSGKLIALDVSPITDFEATTGGFSAGTMFTGDLQGTLLRWVYNSAPDSFNIEKCRSIQMKDGISYLKSVNGVLVIGFKTAGIDIIKKNGDTVSLLTTINSQIHDILIFGAMLLVASWDGIIHIFDVNTMEKNNEVQCPGPVKCMTKLELVFADGSQQNILWVGGKGYLCVLDLSDMSMLSNIWLANPVDIVISIIPYDKHVLIFTIHGQIIVYLANSTNECVLTKTIPTGNISAVAGTLRGPDKSPCLVLGHNDGTLSAYSLPKLELVAFCKVHHDMIRSIQAPVEDRRTFVVIDVSGQLSFFEWDS